MQKHPAEKPPSFNSEARDQKRILFLKYLVIAFAIGCAFFGFYHQLGAVVDRNEVIKEAFTSITTALVITLVYDLFVHRTQEDIIRSEREEVIARTAGNFLAYVDLDRLSDEQLRGLSARVGDSERATKTLAGVLVGESNWDVLSRHLQSLRGSDFLREVEVHNVLRDSNRPGCYELKTTLHFEIAGKKRQFVVAVSSDNEFFNRLVTCPVQIDALAGISESQWNIEPVIAELRLEARERNSKQEAIVLKPTVLGPTELAARWKVPGSEQSRGYLFEMPLNESSFRYTLSFVTFNEYSDAYFYWIAESPMFVRSIILDYSAIKNKIGRVSKNCFIGNVCTPQYDDERGLFQIEVGDLLWPGQGAMIVWRPKYGSA